MFFYRRLFPAIRRRLAKAGEALSRPTWLWRRGLARRVPSFPKGATRRRRSGNRLTATLIWARSFWENPDLRTSGAGRMEQEAFRCLQEIGMDSRFVGQEDRRFPPQVIDSDLVVSHIPGLMRIHWRFRGVSILYTCNTHVAVRNRRLRESAARWGLSTAGLLTDEWFFKTAYEIADYLLIAENDRGIQNFLDHGVPPTKIRRYNNCVDGDIWVPNPLKRQRLSFVCYSSSHGLRKGLPALLEGWKRWYAGQGAELHLVGMPAPEFKILFDKATGGGRIPGLRLKLGRFPGQYEPVIHFVGSCHVGVFPTLEDAQPGTVLEMASCGLPMITTVESGVEFPAEFCRYVEADNPESLAEALEYWYQNQASIAERGRLARQFVLTYHAWEGFHRRFTEIAQEVMEKRLAHAHA